VTKYETGATTLFSLTCKFPNQPFPNSQAKFAVLRRCEQINARPTLEAACIRSPIETVDEGDKSGKMKLPAVFPENIKFSSDFDFGLFRLEPLQCSFEYLQL
jgi:hypothetical protein